MAERRTLGQILLGLGRITEEDIERAIAHQESRGGYFGEALLALDLVSAEEVEWGLASQFDLPYIFPDPEAVDPDAAGLVSPEWALSHLTMPIMRAGDTLTVVVSSPLHTQAVDELSNRTGYGAELALASPAQIRELIRQVYARATAREEAESPIPCSLAEAMSLALKGHANRFGISARGNRAWFWYDESGTVRRRPLDPRWEVSLEEMVSPRPAAQTYGKGRAVFSGQLTREGVVSQVDVRYLADDSGLEYLFRPTEDEDSIHDRFSPPDEGILTEVRLLARSGSARFVVTGDPADLTHELLPHLPRLFFEPSWRSVHIHGADTAPAEDAFSVRLPDEPEQWKGDLEALRAFHFDVVTVDLSEHTGDWVGTTLDVASVVFIAWTEGEDPTAALEAGIRWRLHGHRTEGGHLDWTLNALDR